MRAHLFLPTIAWGTVFGASSALLFAFYVLFLGWVVRGNFVRFVEEHSPV